MRCEGPRTSSQRAAPHIKQVGAASRQSARARGRRGVEERLGGHELFHLRRRAALTSAYKDANQNLEPLPRHVGRAAAGQFSRRKENTKWNFRKQKEKKQKFWHMQVWQVEKINNEGLEGFQGTHLQVQRPWPSTTCTCLLSPSPANVSLQCSIENRCLLVFHTRLSREGSLFFCGRYLSVELEKIHLKKKLPNQFARLLCSEEGGTDALS